MRLRIDSGSEITRLVSPSHLIRFSFSDNGKSVEVQLDSSTYEAQGEKCVPDKTFILYFRDESVDQPQVLLQEEDDSVSALFSFFPEFIDPQAKKAKRALLEARMKKGIKCDLNPSLQYDQIVAQEKEQSKEESKEEEEGLDMPGQFIFLIDRSGSMQGERIVLARQSLLLFLASIPPGSRFNIYSFGSNYNALFKTRSALYDDKNYTFAKESVQSFEADMGGTQVFQAIKHILSTPFQNTLPRHVFLLTDGAVSNPQTVVKLIKQNSSKARFHSFGIGDGASEELVRGVAQAGKGNFYFVGDKGGSSLQTKVIDALSKSSYPCLGNIRIEFEDKATLLEMAPHSENFPILQDRQPFVVFAQLKKDFKDNQQICLKYENLSTHQQFQHSLTLSKSNIDKSNSRSILNLLAKEKLSSLEGNKENEAECVAISLKYKVLSRFTTFVAVERLIDIESGKVEYRRIPVFHNRPSGQVFIKTLTGKTITGQTGGMETVLDMKKHIQDREGIPIEQIRLVSAGRQLEDDDDLSDFPNEQTVHMVLRLRGGPTIPLKPQGPEKLKELREKRQMIKRKEEEEEAKKNKLIKIHDIVKDRVFYADLKQGQLTLQEALQRLTAQFKIKLYCPTLWLQNTKLDALEKNLVDQGVGLDSELQFSYITLEVVISFQKFDGSWSVEALCKAKLIEENQKKQLMGKGEVEESKRDLGLGTTWGVKTLIEKFGEESQSWKLVVKKAKDFLNKQGLNYEALSKIF